MTHNGRTGANTVIRIGYTYTEAENTGATIENCTFINNNLALVSEDTSLITMYNGTIRNCVFQNNSCNYDAKFSISGVLNANDFYCYLENNVFEHPIIVNTGKILSVTDLVILDNETVDCAVGDIVNITATLKLSNQPIADIHSSNLKFIIDSDHGLQRSQ